jgi:hypothetical protein
VSAALRRSELRWTSNPDGRSGNLRLPGLLARAFRARRRDTVPSTLVEELSCPIQQ